GAGAVHAILRFSCAQPSSGSTSSRPTARATAMVATVRISLMTLSSDLRLSQSEPRFVPGGGAPEVRALTHAFHTGFVDRHSQSRHLRPSPRGMEEAIPRITYRLPEARLRLNLSPRSPQVPNRIL